jgi:uncharacterized protein (DUF433 family)
LHVCLFPHTWHEDARNTAIVPVCYNGWYMKEERPVYHERIVTDPRILKGKPVVKGTRIAVDLVLEELSHNPEITRVYPDYGILGLP